ncbi:MGDG synthase family glycosyltransferase [Protofrankia symbiont of Coriaria ruscifolia]
MAGDHMDDSAAGPVGRTRRSGERRALLLSGSLGMGHDVMAQACSHSLALRGFSTRTLDSLRMMGGRAGSMGEAVFRGMLAVPGLYDAVHFSQMRSGGPLSRVIEATASRFLVPELRLTLREQPVELLLSIFATGAAAASRIKSEHPGMVTAVFCTDVCVHRLWVHDNTDLYLVTSATAARFVRRFHPQARIAVVPTPVRQPFYDPPTQDAARDALGIPGDARCVLLMSGSWGLGPLVDGARALAESGVWVLAVAGRNASLAARLRRLARTHRQVIPFGFTDRIPELMAASDLIITSSGDTCSEARVIGRDLLLLDVVPGHGRDNLQLELDRGRADVASADTAALRRSVLAVLDRIKPPSVRVVGTPDAWEQAFGAALSQVELGNGW